MKLKLRFTKFKYIFWSFGKNVLCDIDFNGNKLTTEGGNVYHFRNMNPFYFFVCKYLIIGLFIFILFNRYDLSLSQSKILSYAFGLILTLFVFTSEDIKRQILITLTFVFATIVSFYLGDITLIGFAIKYFVLFSILIMFGLDFTYKPYELLDNENKVITHFLIQKKILKKDNIDE